MTHEKHTTQERGKNATPIMGMVEEGVKAPVKTDSHKYWGKPAGIL
jgi:hypothetical protein